MDALVSQAQDMFNCGNKLTTKQIGDTSSNVLHACAKAGHVNPKKPLVRKNRDPACIPPNKGCGASFGVLRLIYKQQNKKNNSYAANCAIKINLFGKS